MTPGNHRILPGAADASAAPAVSDPLHALRAVVEGTAAGTGREFFRSLVRHLAEAIAVPYASVCEFQDPPHGRALAFWERDHVVEDLPFDFTTSPAAGVLSSDLVHIPAGVLQRFPQAHFLAERCTNGYMAVPLQAAAGNVLGLISVFDDRPMPEEPRRLFIMRIFAARATAELQRIRAEQRLSESEARYRDLFENAPVAYWVVGLDGRIQSANRRWTELIGYPLSEIVGQLSYSFTADTPAGRPRSLEVRRKHEAGESVSGWEIEARHKDGRPVWIKVWMEPTRGADGSLQAARCFCVDVTDRVLAQQERDRLQQQKLYLQEEIKAVHNFEQIIGRSPALMDVLE
jgi:PAS domain S-box-containing protein